MSKVHPDAALKVGATRDAAGLTWVLYKNQFGLSWRAGPIARNIRINTKDYERGSGSPYYMGNIGYATFEKIADHAVKLKAKDYADAKKLVNEYEAARV